MKETVRVVIVEADRAYLQRVCSWMAGLPGVTLVGITDSEPEGMVLAREQAPDIVLLDVKLLPPDSAEPDMLRSRYAGCPVLIMAGTGEEAGVLQALQQGALGSVSKENATAKDLMLAIETVARGGAVLTPRLAGLVLDQLKFSLSVE